MVSVLIFLVVLSGLGTILHRSISGDITHTGRDSRRVRSEFAAESAVQWGLVEISRRRANGLPYTLATHGQDGTTPLAKAGSDGEIRYTGPWRLEIPDLAEFPAAEITREPDGWIAMRSRNPVRNLSGGEDEYIAFKAWYPDDTTLRITGRALVDGAQAKLEMVSILRVSTTPL